MAASPTITLIPLRQKSAFDMATSSFPTEQYLSESFVESAGAVLFRLSTKQICILHLIKKDEYVLAKGRRNCNETRQAAAVREVTEETGLPCRILPLNMATRAPPAIERERLGDVVRQEKNICEPFNLQIRRLKGGDVKLIWWYVATVDEEKAADQSVGEDRYKIEFLDYEDALKKVTFQNDREMIERAINLVKQTYTY
jgi:8-oxo-dGTP pyrophosphatase MutT (NUDIX family)